MPKFFQWIIAGLLLITLVKCTEQAPVSKPLIAYHFNHTLKNSGMVKTAIYGPQAASFAYSKKDTSLDLSINAATRQPLSVKLKENFSLDDYKGYTVAVWVKKYPNDPESYTILSHTSQDSTGTQGWQITTPCNGAWEWWLSDSQSSWQYQPSSKQTINDGNWHLLAFSYDKSLAEARLYYDGKNVAIYSLQNNNININSSLIHIGADGNTPEKQDLFNGELDDLLIWSRVIPEQDIKNLYRLKEKFYKRKTVLDEQFTVMTWNLWNGGTFDGRFVGPQRIVELIKQANPDIILLQQAGQAGTFIAEALKYKLYQRSKNLCVLSRFPVVNAHNIFQPETIGCIQLSLDEEKSVIVCPVQLSESPDISDYIQSGVANVDSILHWESATRGKESQFLLSELNHHIKNTNKIPIIIGGDFNCGSHLDWTEKNARHNYGLSIPFPTSIDFEKHKLIDSYRAIFTDETKHFGYTISPRFDSIMKNRTDFIYFKGHNLIPVNSYLIDEHPKGFPSDHAALVTTFRWQN